ncbi:MAG TPA: hypothetical protein PLU10_06195, partial [Chitinophagaceae bacterium]|nr:hypothetical protein [Chitinophagaceae bacterium]
MKKKVLVFVYALLLSAFTNVAQVNLSNGLVAYWDFNGNANDVSGNGNNGIVFGATLTTGQAGFPNTAYSFNGSSDYIQVPNSASLNFPNGSFTLYALVKPQGFYSGPCHGNIIIDKYGDYNPGWYSLRFSDAYSSSFLNCNSPVNTAQQNFNCHQYNMVPSGGGYVPYINLNEWYCLVAVSDGATLKLYMNGVLVQTQSLSGSLGTNTADLFIGRLNSMAYPYWLNGVIDEIRMYDRAINTAEINALCNCQSVLPYSSSILTNDTTVCMGTGVQLQTNPLIDTNAIFTWSPTSTLSDTTSLNPIATTSTTTTYYLNILNAGCNQLVNGDFESGNIGFSSQYTFAPINTIEGEYYVGNSPQAWNGGLGAYGDHTSGSGNMLLVNGAPIANTNVWCGTVTVNPGQDYAFSAWLMNANPGGLGSNPPILQFSINGNLIGAPFTASTNGGLWQPFYQTWNAGANTSATICIVNQNTQAAGNDFALDDISFSPYSWQTDSVKISMAPSPTIAAGPDTAICNGSSFQLSSSGASTYSWSPSLSLNNANISNPMASPTTNTIYTVTGTSAIGCSNTVTVTVAILSSPGITASASPAAVCLGSPTILTASSSSPFNWSGSVVNGASFTPTITATYTVTSTSSNGCSSTATVTILVNPIPVVIATANPSTICMGNTTTLSGSGATNYAWSGGIINGVAFSPVSAGTYTVTGMDANGCSNTSSTSVSMLPSPVVSATVNPSTICQGEPVIFNGSGANTYTWTGGVMNGISFFPTSTSAYTVTGSDANGCTGTSSVSVLVHPAPSVTGMAIPSVICEGKSSTLFGSGATSYVWSGGQVNGIPFVPLSTTTYTVTGTDGNGCTNSNTVTLSVTPPLNILIANSSPLLCV